MGYLWFLFLTWIFGNFKINDEQLELLAEPIDSPKAAGLGLGLFLARRIANSIGATVRFDSIEGEGTTCTVELPIAEAAPSDWALRGP